MMATGDGMRVSGRIIVVIGLALATAPWAAPCARAGTPPAAPAADLFHAGDYVAAAARFTAALEAPGAPRGAEAGRFHFDLGVCRLRLGQLAEAEYRMRQALLLIDDDLGPGSREGAAAREGLATVLISQGNMIEAEEILHEALATRTAIYGPNNPQTLRTLDLLASVHWLDGEPQQALDMYVRVMSGLRAIHGNVHPLTATTAQNIGAVQMEIATDFSAEIMFRQAVFITESLYGEGHPEMTAPLCGMADVMAYAGFLDRAEGYYRRAIAAIAAGASHSVDVNRERTRAMTGLARVLIAQNRVKDALPLLREAVALHDELRAIAGGDMEAATIGGSPRALLAHALLLDRRHDEAWQVLEAGRGRLAVAWRASRGDSLQRRQLEIEAALAAATGRDEKRHWQQLWNECDAARTALAMPLAVATATPAQVGGKLAAGDVVLGWLDVSLAMGRRAVWTYVLKPGQGVTWRRSPDTAWKASTRQLHRYRDAVAGALPGDARWTALADSVWTQRFAPVASELAGARRLLVVAADPMGGVPLAPLGPRNGPSLLDRGEILAAPSALDFLNAGASPARLHLRPALVVADPPYGGGAVVATARGVSDSTHATPADTKPRGAVLRSALGHNRDALGALPRLAASRDEAAAIRASFPTGPTLMGDGASEAGLSRLAGSGGLANVGLIHLATHALVDCRAPDRSALVLAEAAGDDGLLTAREVRLGWVLDADLVTLSACETGLGRETDDDGMLSLTAAFFAAGARNVVSSLWKVEDQATARLMTYFYEELARSDPNGPPVTVGGALRAAQRRLRDTVTPGGTHPYAAPAAWGGFVAYGGAGHR